MYPILSKKHQVYPILSIALICFVLPGQFYQ